jgi:hypothetical protein
MGVVVCDEACGICGLSELGGEIMDVPFQMFSGGNMMRLGRSKQRLKERLEPMIGERG